MDPKCPQNIEEKMSDTQAGFIGFIAAAAISIVIIFVLFVLAYMYLRKRRKQRKTKKIGTCKLTSIINSVFFVNKSIHFRWTCITLSSAQPQMNSTKMLLLISKEPRGR